MKQLPMTSDNLAPPRGRPAHYRALEARLTYTFKDLRLPKKALTQGVAFQRLEFLGDRVLSLVIAHFLTKTFPQEAEGALAKRLCALVQRPYLQGIATMLDLHGFLRWSPPVDARSRVLSDACEALLGAIYLDGGLDEAQRVIEHLWPRAPGFHEALNHCAPIDAKSELQEWLQAQQWPTPCYTLVHQSGPSHNPIFYIHIEAQKFSATTWAATKQQGQQKAAALALQYFLEKKKI